MARRLSTLDVNLVVGVGGSFDVTAGMTRRAPRAMQRIGLEWLWRLLQEPRRLFKRYLVGNSTPTSSPWCSGKCGTSTGRAANPQTASDEAIRGCHRAREHVALAVR